jgi:hypothetical protein
MGCRRTWYALDDFSVERDGACAADGRFAADVRAGEPGDFAQVMDEEHAGLDFIGKRFSVDLQSNSSFHFNPAFGKFSEKSKGGA